MKLEQKRTESGMFFVVFVSEAELEYDYPYFTRMFIRDAAEEPTVRKTLMALEAMESILEEAETRNKDWQKVIDLGKTEERFTGMKEMHKKNYGGKAK